MIIILKTNQTIFYSIVLCRVDHLHRIDARQHFEHNAQVIHALLAAFESR